jgi:hypothetical protein
MPSPRFERTVALQTLQNGARCAAPPIRGVEVVEVVEVVIQPPFAN